MARRLLLLQVLLNYRTLQGEGYLYALWPWLRQRQDRAAGVKAAAGFLNAHPVTASLALGALRRRIENGETELAAWKDSLCGPLGMVGDELIWDLWKPILFVLGALILLWIPTPGAWIVIAAASLLIYNLPLGWVRCWGVREGYRLGADVLSALNRPLLSALPKYLGAAGAATAGLLLGAALVVGSRIRLWPAAQFVLAFGLIWLSVRRRVSLLYALPAVIVAALLLGLVSS